ncbi:MAG: phosphoribosylformylglycinamidine cyclo-ligase [Proteobacteria bacterium]|nr:MAG: phosphoribosylformylglycinamidine cyclo-ligase [Pseudomonadota bacterium]
MSLYSQRGVSAQKEDVHAATRSLDKGLFPYAFCKLYPDYLSGDDKFVNVMHADGAGTKSILAYLYWKETGDISVWKGIAQDAIVMNLDDLLCTGITDNILFSSTIDRNKRLIPAEVLTVLIESTQHFFDLMKTYGVHIHYLGGETADVGDVVRTIAVNGTMTARWPKDKVISNEKIAAGDVIVGFASYGSCTYDEQYNSGIGSNGLTSARHDALAGHYGQQFPESFDTGLDPKVTYIGPNRLTDTVTIPETGQTMEVGKLLLSPTRTYAPLLKDIFRYHFDDIHGVIHCSGGGQTKCMKYLPGNFRVVKDDLFDAPPIFNLLQEASGSDNREMYQVFNMGHRLEIFTGEKTAIELVKLASGFGIGAKVVGRVEQSEVQELVLNVKGEKIIYSKTL